MPIAIVTDHDLPELLPLMRAYCDFYEVQPADGDLLALAKAMISGPEHEGTQMIARNANGGPTGFATVYWSWSTLRAGRIGVMNDLFVDPAARAAGVGRALIDACAERCREREIRTLVWTTAPDNKHARSVYDAAGASGETFIEYELDL